MTAVTSVGERSERSDEWVRDVRLGLAAVGLALGQLLHLSSLVGLEGWMPGPGLVLTVGRGALALAAARSLLRDAR